MNTVGEVFDSSVKYLSARGIHEAELKTGLLMARLLRCRRLDLQMRRADVLSEPRLDAMRRGLRRLATAEPVQYILGEWDFRDCVFNVDKRVLIPRPETEQLVQLVLDDKELWECEPGPRIVDFGTGSGCIAVSLASERPNGRYLALDVSEDALAVAKSNAIRNKVGDAVIFHAGELSETVDPATVDAIVSNPPYIPSKVVDGLDVGVRDFEPRLALDGGPDGLAILRTLAEEASMALRGGGRIFLEISAEQNQGATMRGILTDFGFENIRVRKDLQGADRFVTAVLADGI